MDKDELLHAAIAGGGASKSVMSTPEAVAYQLMKDIMQMEKKTTIPSDLGDEELADRTYVLSLYMDCLKAVRNQWVKPKTS